MPRKNRGSLHLLATRTFSCRATGLPCLGFRLSLRSSDSDLADGRKPSGAVQLGDLSINTILIKRTAGPPPGVCLICGTPLRRGTFLRLLPSIWSGMFLSALSHIAVSQHLAFISSRRKNVMRLDSNRFLGSQSCEDFDLRG